MAEPAESTTAVCGLLAEDAPIPLDGVAIRADINGFCARVSIAQRYRNRETRPIEAVYVFPLDEGSAVCGFQAIVDGVHFVGEVKERDEAFKVYDDALRAGDSAYLLDEQRPDIFTASLGNVPPGGEVLLELTYVTELTVEGDAVRFMIPTTVSPRYAPASDRVGVGRSEADALNPPVALRVPYGLELTIALDLGAAPTRVESPSHPIAVATDGSRTTVTLAQRQSALDRDFVLLASAPVLESPFVRIERDDEGRHAAVVAFRPTLNDGESPAEVIFVVDRSGSMDGSSIDEVRNALQLCLRSLIPGCRFNIVGFGSTYTALFPESRPYDEQSLAEGKAAVAAMTADLGGTEILPALEFVLSRPVDRALPRQVIVFTDGEVTNTDATIALVRRHAATTRLFAFGIGRGASHHLIRGLARAGGGAAEFVYPGERLETQVLRQFARVLSPAVTNVRMDWGGLQATQAPRALPPIFSGGRLLAYAFIDEPREATIGLSVDTPAGPRTWTLPVAPSQSAVGRTIATLAARTLIRELEESREWMEALGSKQKWRRANRAVQEIVRLGVTYGLASRETSFVAVEHRAVPLQGEAVLRRVPIALTSGWGGAEDGASGPVLGAIAMSAPPPMMARAPRPSSAIVLNDHFPMMELAAAPRDADSYDDDGSSAVYSAPPPPEPVVRPLDRLVNLQRADGSWDASAELAAVLGRTLDDVIAAVEPLGEPADLHRRAWATALALAWLERHAAEWRDEWALLARKADRWLATAAVLAPGTAGLREAARLRVS